MSTHPASPCPGHLLVSNSFLHSAALGGRGAQCPVAEPWCQPSSCPTLPAGQLIGHQQLEARRGSSLPGILGDGAPDQLNVIPQIPSPAPTLETQAQMPLRLTPHPSCPNRNLRYSGCKRVEKGCYWGPGHMDTTPSVQKSHGVSSLPLSPPNQRPPSPTICPLRTSREHRNPKVRFRSLVFHAAFPYFPPKSTLCRSYSLEL